MRLRLISSRQHDGRRYNLPTQSEVAALIVGDIDLNFDVRDIIVEANYGPPKRINELHASYLPLQYPFCSLMAKMVIGMMLSIDKKH